MMVFQPVEARVGPGGVLYVIDFLAKLRLWARPPAPS